MADDFPPGLVIVCIRPDAREHVSPTGDVTGDDGERRRLRALLERHECELQPLFGPAQERLRMAAATQGPPDLSLFYRLALRDGSDARPEEFASRLRGSGPEEVAHSMADAAAIVHAAYFKPRPVGASPVVTEPPSPTRDLTSHQGYLGPAPAGIDAHAAWSCPGGHGDEMRLVDVEDAWRFTHEDLRLGTGGTINAPASSSVTERNHGTAVAGMLSGDVNTIGVVGICPAAQLDGVSIAGEPGGSAAALWRAAERLRAGDVLLVESHNAGPETIFNGLDPRARTDGYVALEFYPDDFAAIRHAVDRGVVVVAAAGNGGVDLADVANVARRGRGGRDVPWPNPFRRDEGGDSGSILAGAGAAPGTAPPARSRLSFSNHGSCVDAQGWGQKVVTTGGNGEQEGDLQGGRDEDRWYTSSFSGTSSAAAMVAGAVVCLQGIARAIGQPPLSPQEVRTLLRETGTPQTAGPYGDAVTHRIGSLPDLRQLIDRLGARGGAPATSPVPQCGPGPAVIIVCGCGAGGGAYDPLQSGPHWSGPHWSGPHWSGPAVVTPGPIPSRPGFAD